MILPKIKSFLKYEVIIARLLGLSHLVLSRISTEHMQKPGIIYTQILNRIFLVGRNR